MERDFANPEEYRRFLYDQWGITCPDDCPCFNSSIERKFQRCREIYLKIKGDLAEGADQDPGCLCKCPDNHQKGMRRIKKWLKLHEEIDTGSGLTDLREVLLFGFQIGIMRPDTQEKGVEYLRTLIETLEPIVSPENIDIVAYKDWMEHPDTRPTFYLRDFPPALLPSEVA